MQLLLGCYLEAACYLRAEYRACFQRSLSIIQKIFALWPAPSTEAQTLRLRSSWATFRRSTTVMPRVSSLCVSMSTKCSDCEVTIDGSKAMAMATGSGRDIPCSPDCSRKACWARLLHSMANLATGVPKLRTCSMSDELSTASPRHRCQPTISMGSELLKTMRAAAASHQMLYSAAGVTLPSQDGAPPMTTQRLTFAAMPGLFSKASATFVSGPSVTITRPG